MSSVDNIVVKSIGYFSSRRFCYVIVLTSCEAAEMATRRSAACATNLGVSFHRRRSHFHITGSRGISRLTCARALPILAGVLYLTLT